MKFSFNILTNIGRLIDEHIRPTFIVTTAPKQSPNQYGFTQNITYLMLYRDMNVRSTALT